MSGNVFLDRSDPPTPASVAKALGARAKYLEELERHPDAPVVEEWKPYGKKLGWTLRLLAGKRNLAFVTVGSGAFSVSFVLGDRAVAAVERSALPPEIVRALVEARRHAEGRGIRIEVSSRRSLERAKLLLEIKERT